MEYLSTHITDTGHNWIIPSAYAGSVMSLTEYYVQSGELVYPELIYSDQTENQCIQANWTPSTDTWYLEVEMSVSPFDSFTHGRNVELWLELKEAYDSSYAGPYLQIRAGDGWITPYSGDIIWNGNDTQYGNNGTFNSNETYTFRVAIIDSNRVKAWGYDASGNEQDISIYSYYYDSSNWYGNSIVRPIVKFYTGSHTNTFHITRIKASDFTYNYAECRDFQYYFKPIYKDYFEGTGYLASHLPNMIGDSYYTGSCYYTSSASALLDGEGSVSPPIFQLINEAPSTGVIWGEAFAGDINLAVDETITFTLRDDTDSGAILILELAWGSGNVCSMRYIDPFPEDTTVNFSIGAYAGNSNIIFKLINCQSGDIVITGSYTDTVALQIYPNFGLDQYVASLVSTGYSPMMFNQYITSISVYCSGAASSKINYLGLCDFYGGA